MSLTVGERVESGAKLLDDYASDWYRFVDLGRLDIQSIQNCILGQIFGSFRNGTRDLGFEGDRAEEERLGFEMTHDEYMSESVQAIAESIENAWCTQITLRKEGEKHADSLVNAF